MQAMAQLSNSSQLTHQSALNKKMNQLQKDENQKECKKVPAFPYVNGLLLVYLETVSCGIYRKEMELFHTIHNQVPLPKKVR